MVPFFCPFLNAFVCYTSRYHLIVANFRQFVTSDFRLGVSLLYGEGMAEL
jgi:hypothetical protein